MTQPTDYPYATHLNVLFPALSLVDVPTLVNSYTDKWHNQTHCKVNGLVVRLGKFQGYVVPKGMLHRTRTLTPVRAVRLMIETAAIVPTGDP